MKHFRNLVLGLVFITLLIVANSQVVFATSPTDSEFFPLGTIELDTTNTNINIGGLVPAGRDGDFSPEGYGTCEFVELINNVLQFLFVIASLIAVIIFIYAGFLMVASKGDVAQITKSKGMFMNVTIGFVIMLSAFLIVNTVLGVLLGTGSPALNWQSIECSYAHTAGEVDEFSLVLERYEFLGWKFVGGDTEGIPVGGRGGGGGNCSVIINTNNPCYPSKLGCFTNTEYASMVCNIESSGGYARSVSATDLCKDGNSFSGGLFQINVLANHSRIPGCSGDFFEKTGQSAQGDCNEEKTNSKGVTYCAFRNCTITNQDMYETCMNAIMDPVTNIEIACGLYANGGWNHWLTSARICNVIN